MPAEWSTQTGASRLERWSRCHPIGGGSGTAYDSRGNLISRPGYTFVYDALDRLVRRQASGELREYHFQSRCHPIGGD